jgi:hypothetical protein
MKQWRNNPSLRVDGCEVWPFVQVASAAGQSQICFVVGAFVLARNNVLDVQAIEAMLPR